MATILKTDITVKLETINGKWVLYTIGFNNSLTVYRGPIGDTGQLHSFMLKHPELNIIV